jgi:hypothetical protein
MGQVQLVEANGFEFFVEVAEREDIGGVQTVGLEDAISFDGVRNTIGAIASSLTGALDDAKPDEASLEFGLELAVKSGKLTGLLVEGSGTTSLKVTLTWKGSKS